MSIRNLLFKLWFDSRVCRTGIGSRRYRRRESVCWNFDQEAAVRVCLETNLDTGDFGVDIGANFGMHTLIMANQVGQIGKVFAFEPIPANLKLLRRNIKLNHFDQRVTVVASAD